MATLDDLEALRRFAELKAKASGGDYDPTKDSTTLQLGPIDTGITLPPVLSNTLAGAGKFFSDIGTGTRQLVTRPLGAMGFLPDGYLDQKAAQDAERERGDRSLMATTPGKIGYGTAAITTGLAAPVTTIPEALGVGGIMGMLQPATGDADRLKNAGVSAAFGGLGQAVANGAGAVWKFIRSPAASTLSDGDKALVQRALDMGYELTPAQVTGKAWQQNLEAALDTFPSTAGKAQARGAANAANSERLIGEALDSAGGKIDQASAASAGAEGMEAGLAAEKARLGASYDKALAGQTINLENARPALEATRNAQAELPASSRTGPANAALDDLLGAGAGSPPGFITKSEGGVPAKVAQDMRSDYSGRSADASGSDKLVYGQMKTAIDGAIESSLPPEAQALFQATNQRYGVYKAVEKLTPKQQSTFLSQLYRGSDSPDQFYTFLGLAPEGEFKQVARGFLSDLVDRSTAADGSVNAAKLSRVVGDANPDARRFFGGAAADTLADVGDVGARVLSQKVPNSGTAQRLMWQGIIQAPGMLGGAYEGYKEGGIKGAFAGAGIGGAAGRFIAPKLIQSGYMSDALEPLMTRQASPYAQRLLADALRRYGASLGTTAEAERLH